MYKRKKGNGNHFSESRQALDGLERGNRELKKIRKCSTKSRYTYIYKGHKG